jgi:hypothetical protein
MESAVNDRDLHNSNLVTHTKLNKDKLNNAFKTCKDNGFKVMVTMSWFGQNQSTITNNRELTNMYFTSDYVDYISPQLYTGNCDSAWDGKIGWNQDTISEQYCSSCVVNKDETDAGHGDNMNDNTLKYNFQNSKKIIWAISHINTLKKLKEKNFNNWNNGFLYWCMNP